MSVYAKNLDFVSSLDLKKVIKDVESNLTNEQIRLLKAEYGELEHWSLARLQQFINSLSSEAQDILNYLNTIELIYVLDKISNK